MRRIINIGYSIWEFKHSGYGLYVWRRNPPSLVIVCGGRKETQERDIANALHLVKHYQQEKFND